jgi:hypothetical protein
MNIELKRIVLEEALLVLMERDEAKNRAEWDGKVKAFLGSLLKKAEQTDDETLKKKYQDEYQDKYDKLMVHYDQKQGADRDKPDGKEDIEDVSDDPLTKQVSWVVKNVFIPADFDKVLDDMFLNFAKEERGSFGSVGVKRLVSKYQDALGKVKKDVSNLMSNMVKEGTVRGLSPYTVEVIKKTYEVFRKQ